MIASHFHRLWRVIADEWSFQMATVSIWAFPPPETEVDRTIRERGERLRRAFPEIDWDEMAVRRSPRDDG